MGGAGPGPGAGRCGPLALRRFAAADQAGVCRPTARAHGGQAVAQAVVPAPLGAAATSAKQARGTSGFQREFPTLVTAALPPEAAGKPVEIWFTDEARVGQQGTITRVWAKRACVPVPCATDATNGRICSGRSARSAAPVLPSLCRR